jgi:guanylate kinase
VTAVGRVPGNFDRVIVNDNVDAAYAEFVDFLKADLPPKA